MTHLKETTLNDALEPIPLAELPALKGPLAGGIFCGVITLHDGRHYAVVRLVDRPDQHVQSWGRAKAWASRVHGELPSRAVASHLCFLVPDLFGKINYWTNEARDSMYTWAFDFSDGQVHAHGNRDDCGAFAVQLIPLTEPLDAHATAQRLAALEAKFEARDVQERLAALEARCVEPA
jgi:hypothetical protein